MVFVHKIFIRDSLKQYLIQDPFFETLKWFLYFFPQFPLIFTYFQIIMQLVLFILKVKDE